MRLKLVGVEPINDRISFFSLTSANDALLPTYSAGAHVEFDLGDVGKRSYSLIDFKPASGTSQEYVVAVQREDQGEGGSLAMHGLKVGDELETSGPKNDFCLDDGDAPALLLAGGIGVTPIISFASELTKRGTDFDLHYTTRSADLSAFRSHLQTHFGDAVHTWYDDSNPIDLKGLIGAAATKTHIYCCGPKGMIEAVRELAEAQGFSKEQIHFELFASPDSQEGDTSFEVQIADGRVFTVAGDKTIVEALEEAGVDVMYDCQRGDCGICQVDILEGEADHRDVVLSETERAEGKVIQICVSRAKSPRLVLDI